MVLFTPKADKIVATLRLRSVRSRDNIVDVYFGDQTNKEPDFFVDGGRDGTRCQMVENSSGIPIAEVQTDRRQENLLLSGNLSTIFVAPKVQPMFVFAAMMTAADIFVASGRNTPMIALVGAGTV